MYKNSLSSSVRSLTAHPMTGKSGSPQCGRCKYTEPCESCNVCIVADSHRTSSSLASLGNMNYHIHTLIFLCLHPEQPALDFLWARFVTNPCVLGLETTLLCPNDSMVAMIRICHECSSYIVGHCCISLIGLYYVIILRQKL